MILSDTCCRTVCPRLRHPTLVRTFVMTSPHHQNGKPAWENDPSSSVRSTQGSNPSPTYDAEPPSIPPALLASGWSLVPLASGTPALSKTWDFAGRKGAELKPLRRKAWSEGVRWLREDVTPVTDRLNVRPLLPCFLIAQPDRTKAASPGRYD